MNAIGRGRAAGKTHKLITENFLVSNNLLLVMNNNERLRIIRDYKLTKKDQDRVLTWDTAKENIRGRRGDILIDNVDDLLANLFHRNPAVVTFTGYCE